MTRENGAPDKLREQVAKAIAPTDIPADWLDAADAAIGVVLGVVADEIKTLPEGEWANGEPIHDYWRGHNDCYEAVLAVVERLRG